MLTLHGVPPTRAIRPIWLLNELDLDCRIESLFPFDRESLRAVKEVNPVGKIPCLVDGDLPVSESVAIMLHLAEAHGGGRFVPREAAGRATMNQWNFFLVTEIEQPLWRAGRHQVIYPEMERNRSEIALACRDCRRFPGTVRGASGRARLPGGRGAHGRRLHARLGLIGGPARRIARLPGLRGADVRPPRRAGPHQRRLRLPERGQDRTAISA